METKYVKMNNNQRELSLGNFCRIVKELSLNKTFAGQPEVFYAIFGVEDVSDSTINNYCIGYRTIGTDFKKIYLKRKNYPNDEFDETILELMSILKGQFYSALTHNEIEKMSKENLKKLSLELYNIAKNDVTVSSEFTKNIGKLIKEEKIYDSICEFLIYIVLEKKQPVYIDKSQRELFENILNNTNISMDELEKFINIQLKDGINYTYSLKKLAKEKNPYAAFELGELEYTGSMTGTPRYLKAYDYFKVAAEKNHPRANWLIAKMLLEGQIGKKTEEDLNKAFTYLKIAEELGSIAAINTIGLCYLNGTIPSISKNIDKAIKYFEKASKNDYVYAHNNLGRIYEEKENYEKAFEHYSFAASLEESWSSNKLGQWYRKGIYVKKDTKKAYEYYNKAIEVPKNILNHWAYFNLAKYYYLEGDYEANIEKDIDKAIKYFEKALDGGIDEAYKELIYIYLDRYKEKEEDKDLEKANYYLSKFRLKDIYKDFEKEIKEKIDILEKEKIILVRNVWHY